VTENITPGPVLYFDGVCNLCERSVQFAIRHDKKKQFSFATLQSDAGQQARAHVTAAHGQQESMILFANGKYYTRSTAALRLVRMLGGAWQLLFIFTIIPRFLRDPVYDLVARNRYKWFGKKTTCMVPTEELKTRFLE